MKQSGSTGMNLYRAMLLLVAVCSVATAESQTLDPASMSFGSWVTSTSSTAKRITLANTQAGPLKITSISTSGDFTDSSNCPISPKTLGAGASCSIFITFVPTALGSLNGLLTVKDNATTSPQTAQVSGVGVLPAVLEVTNLGFGKEFLNTTSAAMTTTLENYQAVPLAISGVAVSGDFAASSTCPVSPNTLPARSTCKISVTFTPTVSGNLTGALTISDSASNSPQSANLSGTGITPITLSPTGLTFSNQNVGQTSASKTVTLTNNQPSALTIAGISIAGEFAQTSTCPLSPNTLKLGSSCTISVGFTPTAAGTWTGAVTITDSASTSPQTVNLSGTATLVNLLSITVTPANSLLVAGSQQQLAATAVYKNGSTANVTTLATWSSSNPEVAEVSPVGMLQGISAGTANVAASFTTANGSTLVTVPLPTLSSITVTPFNSSVSSGGSQQFTATLNYSDGSKKYATNSLTWSSSASSVATVSNSGLATAIASGATTISATSGSVSGSTSLTVVQPQCTPPPAGLAGWWTGNGNTVDIGGLNSGVLENGAGYAAGQVGQAFSFPGNGSSVLINSPVYSPSAGTLMFWFIPTGTGVMTGSYNGGQNRAPGLSIDPSGNLLWEFADLSAQPIAQVPSSQWSHVALTYSTSGSEVLANVYLNGILLASATTSLNSSWYPQVAFGSYLGAQASSFVGSMDEIAIFNQALTQSQISQIYNSFSAGMCQPTLMSVAINPATPSLAPGLSLQMSAIGTYSDTTQHDLTTSAAWSTSDGTIATVGPGGLVSGVAPGGATISASLGTPSGSASLDVAPTLASIQVSPASPSVSVGGRQPFTAVGTFSDNTAQDLSTAVSWTLSSPSVANIAANGLASGISAGLTSVTATALAISGSASLTVTSSTLTSINVTPANPPTVAVGATQQFIATGIYSDGSTQNLSSSVTWTSSVPGIVGISSNGLATGTGSGQTTIQAALGSVSGSVSITVTSLILSTIQITPQNSATSLGASQQFTATGIYSDGSSANITATATWASSSPTVATVSNSTGLEGNASTVGSGSTTISAAFGGVTAATALMVSDPLVSISISPDQILIPSGGGQQYVVTGTFQSGLTQNLTNTVAWGSSLPNVASVSAGGLATSLATGQTVISASIGSLQASANLGVTPIQNIVIIVQENRTPDNLFHDHNLIANGADIASSGLNSQGQIIPLSPVDLAAPYDMNHVHSGFLAAYDNGKMDGTDNLIVLCNPGATDCPPPNPAFAYVNASDVAPYFQLAETYTFADRMFQTNQGPSFPAHQFLYSATSAPTATSDLFASEDPLPPDEGAGCAAPSYLTVQLIDPTGNETNTQYPCFEHPTLSDLLENAGITWRYYTPSPILVWTAPNAIDHVRFGPDWNTNVILNNSQILTDIANNQLSAVSWVIPTGQASDHPGSTDGSGPSWVASVVDAIGQSPYWQNTAILITWDDWGGWYDHVAPPIYNSYEYGFRVPLVVVSPYAKPAYISHVMHDFGSIVRFVEETYGLPSLGYADVRSDDLFDCFNFNQAALPFQGVAAPRGAEYFLNNKEPPTDPDND
jgi:trimeric autotransporter adhesin